MNLDKLDTTINIAELNKLKELVLQQAVQIENAYLQGVHNGQTSMLFNTYTQKENINLTIT